MKTQQVHVSVLERCYGIEQRAQCYFIRLQHKCHAAVMIFKENKNGKKVNRDVKSEEGQHL